MAWHGDKTFVNGLANALVEAEVLSTMEELREFHNYPYRFDEYYKAWAANSFPSEDGDEGWDEFVAEVINLAEDPNAEEGTEDEEEEE